jgi:uncharacterized protein (TIGR02284 family)
VAVPEDTVLAVLDRLVATCRDGEQGFSAAAESAGERGLKDLFARWSQQRAEFAEALEAEMRRLGGTPSGATVTGALHRHWMTLRSMLSVGDEQAILAEVDRGERAALAAYQDALGHGLPMTARGLVEQQFALIKQALYTVRERGPRTA